MDNAKAASGNGRTDDNIKKLMSFSGTIQKLVKTIRDGIITPYGRRCIEIVADLSLLYKHLQRHPHLSIHQMGRGFGKTLRSREETQYDSDDDKQDDSESKLPVEETPEKRRRCYDPPPEDVEKVIKNAADLLADIRMKSLYTVSPHPEGEEVDDADKDDEIERNEITEMVPMTVIQEEEPLQKDYSEIFYEPAKGKVSINNAGFIGFSSIVEKFQDAKCDNFSQIRKLAVESPYEVFRTSHLPVSQSS